MSFSDVIMWIMALGAAYMGALGAGILDSLQSCQEHWRRAKCYEPRMSTDQRESLLYQWRRAAERSKRWIESTNLISDADVATMQI